MKKPSYKAQFIAQFERVRRAQYRAALITAEMRPSEAAMGMAIAEKDAAALWRTLRRAGHEAKYLATCMPLLNSNLDAYRADLQASPDMSKPTKRRASPRPPSAKLAPELNLPTGKWCCVRCGNVFYTRQDQEDHHGMCPECAKQVGPDADRSPDENAAA